MRGLLVGRFQPFHSGHLEVVRALREGRDAPELLVVIGSAQASYTWENPFTAGERYEMIARALAEAGISGVGIVPVPDLDRHALWVSYLVGLLPPFETVHTNNPLTRLLFERAGLAVNSPPWVDRSRFEGVAIRERLAEGREVGGLVPAAVAAYLGEIGAAARLAMLRPAIPRPGSAGAP